MTQQQKALARYWFSGAVLLVVVFSQIGREYFRVLFFLALPVGFLVDHFMRPPKPEGVPTPLAIIEKSSGWKFFFVVYAFGAVIVAMLAISVDSIGSLLSENPWIIFPAVLLPVIGPLVQHQIVLYRAFSSAG